MPVLQRKKQQQKVEKPRTYVKMKPTTFAKQSYITKSKKWMKFKI